MVPIYSATKAYNLAMSRANADAYRHKIDIMHVTPDAVMTGMAQTKLFFSVEAKAHGRTVINHLGRFEETRGHWLHACKPYIRAIWPLNHIIDMINANRVAASNAKL